MMIQYCKPIRSLRTQNAMALIISLIFLVIISLVGLTVLNVSTLEEKMAAGTRDKDLALQAAEMAMVKAENRIETSIVADTGFTENCSSGLCGELPAGTTTQRWENSDICGTGQNIWKSTKSFEVVISGAAAASFSQNPRYFIEVLRSVDYGDNLMMGNIGDTTPGEEIMIYRITAIGYGGSDESKVILQSTYGKRI